MPLLQQKGLLKLIKFRLSGPYYTYILCVIWTGPCVINPEVKIKPRSKFINNFIVAWNGLGFDLQAAIMGNAIPQQAIINI